MICFCVSKVENKYAYLQVCYKYRSRKHTETLVLAFQYSHICKPMNAGIHKCIHKYACVHTHTHTHCADTLHTHTLHTHTHTTHTVCACMHACTHTHTHMRTLTHTHTHTCRRTISQTVSQTALPKRFLQSHFWAMDKQSGTDPKVCSLQD